MRKSECFIVKTITHSAVGGKNQKDQAQCFFFVSSKIFKTAVLRNKIKRQLRVITRSVKLDGKKIQIIPQKEIIGKSFEELKVELLSLLEK